MDVVELAAVNSAYGGDAWNLVACGPLLVADDRLVKRVGVRFDGRAVDPLWELDDDERQFSVMRRILGASRAHGGCGITCGEW